MLPGSLPANVRAFSLARGEGHIKGIG
jgi:hypothetical protein